MKKLIIATLAFTIATPALATTCKIVGISDGDTATKGEYIPIEKLLAI
ncbi:hypothetical protein [Moraxella sp. VT-16-12]|nr:hypothetical protein [Moraxella sp. VT-16-12]